MSASAKTFQQRYALRAALGEGGGGIVYEAFDVVTSERVALKLLRRSPESDKEVGAIRFQREVTLAARIASPNVVAILGHGVDDEGRPFLVMPLLEGEDLGSLLQRSGRLTPRQAGAIALGIARGLTAAHGLGIVHRDVKPSNVFLACEKPRGEVVVKLLDFGLAKASEHFESSATTTGTAVGTPFYMSPEQMLADGQIDRRTDLWALGVLVFYCLTGQLPFDTRTMAALVLAVNEAERPRVTELAPDLPEALDAWFAKACAKVPADRFDTAEAMIDALLEALSLSPDELELPPPAPSRAEGAIAASPLAASRSVTTHRPFAAKTLDPELIRSESAEDRRRRRGWRPLALGGLVVVLAVLGFALSRRGAGGLVIAAGKRASMIALPHPLALTGASDAPYSLLLADLLTLDLSLGEHVRVAPPFSIGPYVTPSPPCATEPECLARLSRLAHRAAADYVIAPTRVEVDAKTHAVVADVAVIDVRDQRVSKTFRERAPSMPELALELGKELRAWVGAPRLDDADEKAFRRMMPTSDSAQRQYATALLEANGNHPANAVEGLRAVTTLEPTFADGHWALAVALTRAHADHEAAEEAKRAVELTPSTPRERRLRVEALASRVRQDFGRTAELYTALSTFFPDESTYEGELAKVLLLGNRAADALVVVESALKRRPWSQEPLLAMARASALSRLGRYRESFDASGHAAEVARDADWTQLQGDALIHQAQSATYLGDIETATRLESESLALYETLGDEQGELWVRGMRFERRLRGGELAAARADGEALLAINRRAGDRDEENLILADLATLATREGKYAEAREHLSQALELAGALQLKARVAIDQTHLAALDVAAGNAREGQKRLDIALDMALQANARAHHLTISSRSCESWLRLGEVERARKACGEAESRASEDGSSESQMAALGAAADFAATIGDDARAARLVTLALQPTDGEPRDATSLGAHVELSTARHELLRGNWQAALGRASSAREHSHALSDQPSTATAEIAAAEALVEKGAVNEASERWRAAKTIADAVDDFELRQRVALVDALLRLARGDKAEALALSSGVARAAHENDWFVLEMEARLIAARSGRPRELEDVLRLAHGRGHVALERRAKALRR